MVKKRFVWFGKEVQKKVPVFKKSIGAHLKYQELRSLEQVFQDLQTLEEASGLNFSDYSFKKGCLNLKRFTKPWWIFKGYSYSEDLLKENPGQENTATVEICTLITSDKERDALKSVSDELLEAKKVENGYYETKYPHGGSRSGSNPDTMVRKFWKGTLDEDAIAEFFNDVKKIDERFGMTLRFLKESGIYQDIIPRESQKDLKYIIDLSTGNLSRPDETFETFISETGYGHNRYLDVYIYKDELVDRGRFYFGLKYSN